MYEFIVIIKKRNSLGSCKIVLSFISLLKGLNILKMFGICD